MIERQRTAALTGLATVLAVSLPVVQNFRSTRSRDSFPLSHYPMFAVARPETMTVAHLVGRTSSGDCIDLSCRLLGPGGMNQHRKQIQRAARRQDRSVKLTNRLAKRVARRSALGDVIEVQLVTRGYRLDDWYEGIWSPVSDVVHATSPVPRPEVA